MNTAHVLVIEDEPGIAQTVVYALTTDGMRATWHGTAREGLAALAAGGVDLVVLDVGLPDANGFEVCKRIRAASGVPIVFLTARADEVDRIVGLEIGGDDYVAKPFSPRELSARVRAILRRTARRPVETTISDSPLALDPQRLVATYFGSDLRLPRYQFRILAALAERPGWVLSRDQLLDRCWEEPDRSFDRAVDTQIKELRAALRVVRPDIDAIRTHRGAGYSLTDTW